jgi:cytochrome d ubiquinol oxidase subunit II
VTVLLFVAGGFWVAQMPGYRITAMPDANSAFTPLAKTVEVVAGAWFDNYAKWPVTKLFPALGVAVRCWQRCWPGAQCPPGLHRQRAVGDRHHPRLPPACLFPFIMPSSLDAKAA